MAFKPKNANGGSGGSGSFENRNFPVPKAGARKARVSLIVELGVQEREDFEDPKTKETKPQKPCQQVAVFVDLVNDVVDYGGDIGKAQYRLMLNKSFGGVVQGINFAATPPKDKDGKTIEGKPWGLHPASMLTKVAKAIGKPEVVTTMDIEALLNGALVVDVDITEKESDKEDDEGNPIIYRYVNAKGLSKVGMRSTGETDDDGNDVEVPDTVAELKQPARCITFDSATKEDIKFLRGNLIKLIKLANDYAGSNMQKAIEAFEAEQAEKKAEKGEAEEKPASTKKPAAKSTKATKPKADMSDMDDDVPF